MSIMHVDLKVHVRIVKINPHKEIVKATILMGSLNLGQDQHDPLVRTIARPRCANKVAETFRTYGSDRSVSGAIP